MANSTQKIPPKEITPVSGELYKYLVKSSVRENDILRRLREETSKHDLAGMQISPDEGQFLALLVKLSCAKKALEVGTFTGYSALCVAQALPPEGKIICCDVSQEYTSIGKKYWKEAGVEHKIDLRIAPAVDTMDNLITGGEGGTFDFIFIDADKENYDNYYEKALKLVRNGGLICIDNTLWDGKVIDSSNNDESTKHIRALNEKIHTDCRVFISMIPIADGLTLCLKL